VENSLAKAYKFLKPSLYVWKIVILSR